MAALSNTLALLLTVIRCNAAGVLAYAAISLMLSFKMNFTFPSAIKSSVIPSYLWVDQHSVLAAIQEVYEGLNYFRQDMPDLNILQVLYNSALLAIDYFVCHALRVQSCVG